MFKSLLFVYLFFSFASHLQAKNLSIASWNLAFLPRVIDLYKFNDNKRAVLMAEHFKESSFEVVFFQEVFSKKSYNLIAKKMREKYPYNTGTPVNKQRLTSNGLVIFSKYPLSNIKHHFFRNCSFFSADCLSSKGFLTATVNIDGEEVKILNTHLQSLNKGKARIARVSQLRQIQRWLKQQDEKAILAGDFNINKYDTTDSEYRDMLNLFKVRDEKIVGYPYTFVPCVNTLVKCSRGSIPQRLDYIFTKGIDQYLENYSVVKLRGKFAKTIFNKSRINDLSDHFLIRADILI